MIKAFELLSFAVSAAAFGCAAFYFFRPKTPKYFQLFLLYLLHFCLTTDKLKRILETESQSAKELSNEDLTFVNAAGVPDMSFGATGENADSAENIFI